MSRDKVDGSEMERNLHGDENVDMELCSQVIPGDSNAQDAEKAEDLNPVARMRKVNLKDREDVEDEDIYHARRSLGGYLARVSTVMNQVKVSIAESRECEEVRVAVKNLEHAWDCYCEVYQNYVLKNLPVQEFERVEQCYSKIYDDYSQCVKAAEDHLRPKLCRSSKNSVKSSDEVPKLSPITSTRSKSTSSSRSSKLKERKRNVELKKLMAEQALELAHYEAEMEKRKIDIEMQKQKIAKQMRFEALLEEKEVDLLAEEDDENASIRESFITKSELDPTLPLQRPLPKEEQTASWVAKCYQASTKRPPNGEATSFVPHSKRDTKKNFRPPGNLQPNNTPLNENVAMTNGLDGTTDERITDTPGNSQAVLLRVTTLQAMQPVKFNGNAADFPVFRRRIRDNLEDGLLSDAQKIEFLPKFVSGEAYEVVERSAGCSYGDIVANLEDRYGQPAAVAAACIEKLTVGPKLGNRDFSGLRNFAEHLQCATKRLEGDYEREASTTANMKLIAGRLPDYLINKWADVSYSIRERGNTPGLNDLAQFVKRQAAIKNDPGFAGVVTMPTAETKGNRKKPFNKTHAPPNARQTSAFATDIAAKGTGRGSGTENGQRKSLPGLQNCLCCSGSHELASCVEFQKKDLQARWDIVKNHRLCHVCMRPGHHRNRCESQKFCRCGSDKRHHNLLHNPTKRDTERGNQACREEPVPVATPPTQVQGEQPRAAEQRSTVQYATLTEPTRMKTVLLHVIPVKISSLDGKFITTYGLLDNGSRGTMISSDVAKELGLKGRKEMVSVSTLLQREDEEFEVVEFQLQSASGEGEVITVEEGLVSEKFNIAEKCLPEDIDRSSHPHLVDIEIPEVKLKKVSVLIGKDVSEAHEVFEVRKSKRPDSQLQAQRGPLGWVITGTIVGSQNHRDISVNFVTCDKKLHDQVENFWKVEGFGTRSTLKPGNEVEADRSHRDLNLSREDMRAVAILEKTTKLTTDQHYETGLMWRRDDVQLPSNRREAERRLQSLKRKFHRDPSLEEKYRATMDDYIAKGYARKLTEEEVSKSSSRTWYLPHFAVTSSSKANKVRIVFDAAAEHEGTSLNKNLLQGPDYTNSLVGVLLRFREENVALVGDIESMFHQVKVRPEDQDSLRFLWWSESVDETPQEYAMTVHIFGAADSPCSANSALLRTADDNERSFDAVTIETLRQNFYVDDLLKSMPTPESTIKLMEQLIELCAKGGFNLTKFVSNDRKVWAAIPLAKRADPSLDVNLDELPVDRALGVRWYIESDTFGFKVLELGRSDTMRGVLSTICSVFDPLNLAAPVMLPAKQIMQELWRMKKTWDQPLDGELLQRWLLWKNNLPLLANVEVPRCYFSRRDHEGATLQLHHFCDASEVGYGTSSYLRITYPGGTVECAFVMGKSRNAPIKPVSIPRLELQGALLAARVDFAVRKELNFEFERVVFWTDSMITLNYIYNENRRFQTYVANRIAEIRDLTVPEQWRHCPGKLNPADDVSRGLEMNEFLKNERWLKGPSFLWKSEEQWPDRKYEVAIEKLEIKKEVYLTTVVPTAPLNGLLTRFSSWITLLRTVAWLLKFLQWIKWFSGKKKEESSTHEIPRCISQEELEKSKREVVTLVQKGAFPQEVKDLRAGRQVKVSSNIVKLKPVIMSDGVLRVGGRISKAPISPDAMNPMILPKNHHITTILIRYVHERNGHCGVEQVLSLLREQFWVVKGRAAVKEVIGRCISCKKRMAPRMSQAMAELPKIRLTPYEPPFTYSGVDYFGPFYVKRGRGKVAEKRWGAIFVCMNSRAVHLEVARSLETDDFILLLMRFLNRRGHVKELRSDNGTNFVGADREIKEAIERIDTKKVGGELMQRGCKWVFHPPGASHMSGVWERLVKSVKRSLKAILGKDLINEEVLQTVFTEAERIANSRPLTRNSSTPDDDEPLTPGHFLNIRPTANLPPEMVDDSDKFSRKRWRQAQILANHYWKRWLREYIPSLQERQKWHKTHKNLAVGELVLIADDNVPRNQWPIGRVIHVFPGPDGLVRSAEVKAKGSTYKRPITKICLLEGSSSEEAP